MKIDIRLATLDDVPSILSLHEEATQDLSQICPSDLGEGFKNKAHTSEEKAYFENVLGDLDAVLLVGQVNNIVVGFGLGNIERHGDDFLVAPFLTVNILAVKREWRGKKIGECILAGLEDWGRRNQLTAADLIVFEGNEKAQGLFKKSDYRYIEHRMVKKL
jgi:ribosomal protein S18 acetylase RimI-like enzyme